MGWPADSRWLDALAHAVVGIDAAGMVEGCNRAGVAMLADPEPVGKHFATEFLEPGDCGGFAEVLAQAFAGVAWRGELQVRRADAAGPSEIGVVPIDTDGSVDSVLLVAGPVTGEADRAVALAERLTRLASMVSRVLSSDSLGSVTDIVIGPMADAAGATTASLSLLVDDETLSLIGLRGGRPGAASRWATFPLAAETPASVAARSGHPLVLIGRAAIHARFPDLEAAAEGERSMVCLPLVVAGKVIGVTSMSFPGRRDIDAAELQFFRIMADTVAQAVDRLRAQEEADDHARKLEFLAETSAALASSLDYQATLRRVAWLAVPRFADWAAVALARDGTLETLAVAHTDPAKLSIVDEYQRRYPPDKTSTTGGYEVLRSGKSQLMPEITDDVLMGIAQDDEQLRMLRALEFRSGIVVPLKARGRTIGTMTWVRGETGRRFGPADLGFGEEIARRAAIAIDNSELHSELREVAERLQHEVLPPALPALPRWELAALYSSSGRAQVGGDFYDAIPLDENRLALFVGDVMGRGVQAAAAMAKVSASLRTMLAVNPDPGSILDRLDLLFEQYPSDQLVTLVYAVADPGRGVLTLVNAGHPTPLVLTAGGEGRFLDEAEGQILGAGRARRTPVEVPLGLGDTVLLFTDGLVERRTEDLEVGLRRLMESAIAHHQSPLTILLDQVVSDVPDPTRDDDLAILAARRLG